LSSESSSCRIDWRPSRLLCVALAGLGVLGALGLALSALPVALKWPLAALALARGLHLARREWRRAPAELVFDIDGGEAVIRSLGRSERIAGAQLALRGVLATLAWRDEAGRRRALCWAADTLPVSARRALRLRFGGVEPA
jgi:toxin CptA